MTALAPSKRAPADAADATLRSRARASYLGLAIGDALGATVEFMTPREIAAQYGCHRDICGGGWLHLPAGQVTDDTTMALALGEAILQRGELEASAVAAAFDQWMRAKPIDIGHTVRAGILHYRRTGDAIARYSEMSAGNGACMRCLPAALATLGLSEPAVRAASRQQAHTTHHNTLSDAGTETVMLMLQDLLRGRPLRELLAQRVQPLAQQHPEFAFRRRRCDNPSAFIGDTLCAVFASLFDSDSFESCLIAAVNRGGDADTTGAIAGMLAGACYGEQAIPARWIKALDARVRQRCEQQAEQLLALASAHTD